MPITVPQLNYQPAMVKAPQMSDLNLGDAINAGLNIGASVRNKQLRGDVGGELGEQVLLGSEEAANTLIEKYGTKGAEAVKQLMAVTALRNEKAADGVSKTITERAEYLTKVYDAGDSGTKSSMMKRYAMKVLGEDKDREFANDLMFAAQLEDEGEMDTVIEEMIDIAAGGNEFLTEWKMETFGDTKELRKKTRQNIDASMKTLNTRIGAIETSFGKIDSLLEQARAGNRTAISSVLVALVKLQDPNSAVLVAEMENALNQESPLAAALSLAQGEKGVEEAIRAAMAKVDTLNPGNIDTDDIRATASALVQANVRPMQQEYENNLMAAENLSKGGAKHAMTGNFGQRLFDMNKKFFTDPVDANSRDLTYEEINQQRNRIGLRPLRVGEPPVVVQPEEEAAVTFTPDQLDDFEKLKAKRAKEAGNK